MNLSCLLKFRKLASLLLPMLASVGIQPKALACASCGSGGDDPLILYPNENWKFYGALGSSTNFKTVKVDGSLGKSGGPQRKNNATVAIGKSFNEDLFFTFTVPYIQNVHESEKSQSKLGDPSFAARYTLERGFTGLDWGEQLQLVFGHRFKNAKSVYEDSDDFGMDIFGFGFPETKLGLDVWFGTSKPQFGAAHMILIPGHSHFESGSFEPGIGQRTTLSAGYTFETTGRIVGGVVREIREQSEVNGVKLEDSASTSNTAYLTADYYLSSFQSLRFTVSRKSAFGDNENTGRNDTFTLAYLHSIPVQ